MQITISQAALPVYSAASALEASAIGGPATDYDTKPDFNPAAQDSSSARRRASRDRLFCVG